jgi:4-methylaminobutanoate oxidase (formaldehyde-forming)
MRLEKGFRDMGHDIDSTDNPLEAGLGFAVAWDKPGGFVGREALMDQRELGAPTRRLVNVLLGSSDVALIGDEPLYRDGKPAGIVRSGGFRHSLGAACGIAEVRGDEPLTADLLVGSTFEVDVAGVRVAARVSLSRSSIPRAPRCCAEHRAPLTERSVHATLARVVHVGASDERGAPPW